MKELINKIKDKPDFITARAAGSILHDFYSGAEKMFEKIALNVDNNMPQGEDWHIKLLLQMTQNVTGKRDSLIDSELLQNLKE